LKKRSEKHVYIGVRKVRGRVATKPKLGKEGQKRGAIKKKKDNIRLDFKQWRTKKKK